MAENKPVRNFARLAASMQNARRGGRMYHSPNLSSVKVAIDSDNPMEREDHIWVDCFVGVGADFKRRGKSLINIRFGEDFWSGTLEQLMTKLKQVNYGSACL